MLSLCYILNLINHVYLKRLIHFKMHNFTITMIDRGNLILALVVLGVDYTVARIVKYH